MDLCSPFPAARAHRLAAFGYWQHRTRIRSGEKPFAQINRVSFGVLRPEIRQAALLTEAPCNNHFHQGNTGLHRRLHLSFSRIAALSSWTISCEALMAAAC